MRLEMGHPVDAVAFLVRTRSLRKLAMRVLMVMVMMTSPFGTTWNAHLAPMVMRHANPGYHTTQAVRPRRRYDATWFTTGPFEPGADIACLGAQFPVRIRPKRKMRKNLGAAEYQRLVSIIVFLVLQLMMRALMGIRFW